MGSIYESAESIVVWLGKSKDGSDFAMAMFANPSTLKLKVNEFDGAQYSAILALCNRSYWRRVWVLQEIYLAKRFVVECGNDCISDTNLDDALAAIGGPNQAPQSFREEILSGRVNEMIVRKRRVDRSQSRLRVWLLYGINQGLECSEPRGYIYAMLGLGFESQNAQILPDYKKPLMDVYLETIAFCENPHSSDPDQPLTFTHKLAEKLRLAYDENLKRLASERIPATVRA